MKQSLQSGCLVRFYKSFKMAQEEKSKERGRKNINKKGNVIMSFLFTKNSGRNLANDIYYGVIQVCELSAFLRRSV